MQAGEQVVRHGADRAGHVRDLERLAQRVGLHVQRVGAVHGQVAARDVHEWVAERRDLVAADLGGRTDGHGAEKRPVGDRRREGLPPGTISSV